METREVRHIEKKETIGIILPDSICDRLAVEGSQINVRAYQEAADQFMLTAAFFKVKAIQPGRAAVKAWISSENGYEQRTMPLPQILYSRGFLSRKQQRFLTESGIIFYNHKGFKHDKYRMHTMIMKDPELRHSLPRTAKADPAVLKTMMASYDSVLLKPVNGSLGAGIMHIEKISKNSWRLEYQVKRKQWEVETFQEEIPEVILKAFDARPYLIQEKILLATCKGRPFDLRVVVQRNHTGNWVVAGILCKVSPSKDQFITNLSQGGQSLSFEDVFTHHPDFPLIPTRDCIEQKAVQLARHIDRYAEHIADIAFDLALDTSGRVYFIECNFRGRYGNVRYKGKRLEEWKAKHTNPIGYARFLYNQMKHP